MTAMLRARCTAWNDGAGCDKPARKDSPRQLCWLHEVDQ